MPAAVAGQAYSLMLTATGGSGAGNTYSVVAGQLPTGLTLNSAGVLSGMTNPAGTYNFTVHSRDSQGNTVTRDFTLVVYSALSISPGTLPPGMLGGSYSQVLIASGGSGGGYAFSVSAGQLPPGLNSDSQQAEMNENKATFLQDVVITQGSIIIHADKVVVLRHTKGDDEMIASGRPATFFQILDNGKPVNASASELRYQLKDRLVTLTGKAELKQNDNQVNGDVIRYDIQKQQMIAQSSGKGSRVKTIFLPQEIDEFNKAGKP